MKVDNIFHFIFFHTLAQITMTEREQMIDFFEARNNKKGGKVSPILTCKLENSC